MIICLYKSRVLILYTTNYTVSLILILFGSTQWRRYTMGVPGQMTWLEDPPPWLKPWLRPALLCFGNSVNRK